MWDFSRYNVIVKQVEGASDILHAAANTITPLVKSDPHGIAPKLLELLREAAADLDIQALRMLALYDPAAADYVSRHFTRDPRRGIISAIPILFLINGNDLCVCSNPDCHRWFTPSRKPRDGENHFCQECGKKAAKKLAQRRYVAQRRYKRGMIKQKAAKKLAQRRLQRRMIKQEPKMLDAPKEPTK
jgi:hypothetical protein